LESDLQDGVMKAINQTIVGREFFIDTLMENIATVLEEGIDRDVADIDLQLEEMQNELVAR